MDKQKEGPDWRNWGCVFEGCILSLASSSVSLFLLSAMQLSLTMFSVMLFCLNYTPEMASQLIMTGEKDRKVSLGIVTAMKTA